MDSYQSQCVTLTKQVPDLVLYSEVCKEIIMMELTVPWEEDIQWAHIVQEDLADGELLVSSLGKWDYLLLTV